MFILLGIDKLYLKTKGKLRNAYVVKNLKFSSHGDNVVLGWVVLVAIGEYKPHICREFSRTSEFGK